MHYSAFHIFSTYIWVFAESWGRFMTVEWTRHGNQRMLNFFFSDKVRRFSSLLKNPSVSSVTFFCTSLYYGEVPLVFVNSTLFSGKSGTSLTFCQPPCSRTAILLTVVVQIIHPVVADCTLKDLRAIFIPRRPPTTWHILTESFYF